MSDFGHFWWLAEYLDSTKQGKTAFIYERPFTLKSCNSLCYCLPTLSKSLNMASALRIQKWLSLSQWQNRKPIAKSRNKPKYVLSINLQYSSKNLNGGMIISSINDDGKTGQLLVKE